MEGTGRDVSPRRKEEKCERRKGGKGCRTRKEKTGDTCGVCHMGTRQVRGRGRCVEAPGQYEALTGDLLSSLVIDFIPQGGACSPSLRFPLSPHTQVCIISSSFPAASVPHFSSNFMGSLRSCAYCLFSPHI